MDNPVPKVSFIPKSPLAREEGFFERKRPRSAIGIIAILLFVGAVGSYVGLYFYDVSLTKQISKKTKDIEDLQSKIGSSKEITEAKIFRSRAELAKELLDQHITVSPVFLFLSENTLGSILYDKFSFSQKDSGGELELSGEAPSYAALAYQADVLRKKTDELSHFSISNVALSKFGTVTFALKLSFDPKYISYTKEVAKEQASQTTESSQTGGATSTRAIVSTSTPLITPNIEVSRATTSMRTGTGATSTSTLSPTAPTSTMTSASSVESGATTNIGWDMVAEMATTSPPSVEVVPTQSVLRSLWSRFKFW